MSIADLAMVSPAVPAQTYDASEYFNGLTHTASLSSRGLHGRLDSTHPDGYLKTSEIMRLDTRRDQPLLVRNQVRGLEML